MLQNPQEEPCKSNSFPLIGLRTLLRSLRQEQSTTHLQSMASALFHKTWGGIGALLPVFRIFFSSDYPARIGVLSEHRESKDLSRLFSAGSTLFSFPYALTSLFLTLTKTA